MLKILNFLLLNYCYENIYYKIHNIKTGKENK